MLKLLSEKGHDHCLVLAIWSHFVHILGRVSFRLHSVTSFMHCVCSGLVKFHFTLYYAVTTGLSSVSESSQAWVLFE